SFAVVGCDATWSKAQPGIPLQEIAKSGIANPVMIVDEIEKAGMMTSSGGSRVSLPDALLGLLETSPSTAWEAGVPSDGTIRRPPCRRRTAEVPRRKPIASRA
ncbi:MAG: hypothetical protein ABJ251_22950, partial [Paracoccaceae bacterium]